MGFKYITYTGASHSFFKNEGATPDDAIEECLALVHSVDKPVVLIIDGISLFFVRGSTFDEKISEYVFGNRIGDDELDLSTDPNPRTTAEIPASVIARIVREQAI